MPDTHPSALVALAYRIVLTLGLTFAGLVAPHAAAQTGTSSAPHPTNPPGGSQRIERQAKVMGTTAWISVSASSRADALEATEVALLALEETEALLSTWNPATPLSVLNTAPVERPLALPPELTGLLAEAVWWNERTHRAFDPAVGALVDAWGLRGAPREPSADELSDALEATGARAFAIDPNTSSATRLHTDAWLDAGGFGKGAGLRKVAGRLRAMGITNAVLDLGGQLQIVGGGSHDGPSWTVDVAHPVERMRSVARLRIREASVATSGTSERGGHILDPHTGRPVPAWGSVTVVAEDAVEADILSTALYVMGPADGMTWLARLNRGKNGGDGVIAVLFLEMRNGCVVPTWNEAMDTLLETAADGAARPLNLIHESRREDSSCNL